MIKLFSYYKKKECLAIDFVTLLIITLSSKSKDINFLTQSNQSINEKHAAPRLYFTVQNIIT